MNDDLAHFLSLARALLLLSLSSESNSLRVFEDIDGDRNQFQTN